MNRGKAKQLWNKLARLDPQDAAADNAVLAALDEGYRQASEGNFTQAMRSWRRLINQGIQHPVLLQNYAIACDRVERYEDRNGNMGADLRRCGKNNSGQHQTLRQ